MAAPAPSDALNQHLAFTQRALDTLKPHTRGLVEYYDTKMPGLALRVQPTGKKTFYLNYCLRGSSAREGGDGECPPS